MDGGFFGLHNGDIAWDQYAVESKNLIKKNIV
jgi:hypothetical protein